MLTLEKRRKLFEKNLDKEGEGDTEVKKKSNHLVRKIKKRTKRQKLDAHLEYLAASWDLLTKLT
jgi:hypothetical protein